VEVVVFPKSYQQVAPQVRPNAMVVVLGRVAARADYPRLIAEQVIPLEQAGSRLLRSVELALDPAQDNGKLLDKLKQHLLQAPGLVPVFLCVPGEGDKVMRLRLPDEYRIEPTAVLLEVLEQLLGEAGVSIHRRPLQLPTPERNRPNSRMTPAGRSAIMDADKDM
jgi:DNA polymerase-3 subunit alpha